MFMHGEAAIFCGDAVMCRMLAALCGSASSGIVIADGDDAGMQADAFRYCRENALPLILFSIVPAELSLPADISGRILSRPFLFADFTAAVEQLSGTVSVSDQQEKTEERESPVPAPQLCWDPVRRLISCGGNEVLLGHREADVFTVLYAASPAPVSREKLQAGFSRTAGNGADVYISYLRKKLAQLPMSVQIHFVRGCGYALLVQSAVQQAEEFRNDQLSGEI